MSDWDEYAAGWDESAAVRAYADAAFTSLAALADTIGFSLDGATACDFGCGTGLLTERLVGRCTRIDAVDTSTAMLEVLAAKIDRHGWTHVSGFARLPSEPQGYDLIVCSSVLSFVDDHPAMVELLHSHLAPGGLFVQWDWEPDPDDDEPGGLSADEIRRALEGAGFEEIAVDIGFEVPVEGHTMRPVMGSGRRRA